jgi:hypothetical protein
MASAVLEVTAGPSAGKVLRVRAGTAVVLGRGSACGDAKLADTSISREHGRLSMSEAGALVYTDSSSNGTWYVRRGDASPTETLKDGAAHILEPGDMLLMGHTCLVVAAVSRAPILGVLLRPPVVAGVEAPPVVARKSFLPATTVDDSNAVFHHPFTRILARGLPVEADDLPYDEASDDVGILPPLTDEELGAVGREILREL